MSRVLWWIVGILALTVVFVGLPAATSLRDTVAKTGGTTAGLVVGGIPDLVSSFKVGMGNSGNPVAPAQPQGPQARQPAKPAPMAATPPKPAPPAQTRQQGQRAGRNG